MVGEVLARIVALLFYGVCRGIVPAGAEELDWNKITGWEPIGGYVWEYGFHPVDGGFVLVTYHPAKNAWLLFVTDEPPARLTDEWHVSCGGWLYYPTGSED